MKKKKDKWQLKMTRRQVLKAGMIGGAGMMLPLRFFPAKAFATPIPPLSDPTAQDMFVNAVPDALAPGFKILTPNSKDRMLKVFAGPSTQMTGLKNGGSAVPTDVWGYGLDRWNGGTPTWPGPTFEAKSNQKIQVRWENRLVDSNGDPLPHLLPLDPNLHWAYSLQGYNGLTTLNQYGVPIVMHLHGGHTDWPFDGNPEFFFSPGYTIKGPRFVDKTYMYDNSQVAGTLWYHDHGLGITRINVYAGLAGFYILRDKDDTGDPKNKLNLPTWPYEKGYAIQDRMFYNDGRLFYPAYPGDPAYADFITGEGVTLTPPEFPYVNPGVMDGGGGPTALAEFFGDHMLVNGRIWPKEDVEPRNYRIRLLNGCDSRFMAIRLRDAGNAAGTPINIPGGAGHVPFKVIGSDQGLASSITEIGGGDVLLFEPGSRYDIVVNFYGYEGRRIIVENIGGDEPFGGKFTTDAEGPEQLFARTDRIMAFDVVLDLGELSDIPDVSPTGDNINYGPNVPTSPDRTRKVALFEGSDEFGRLQPLLGTAEPATDYQGNDINWPDTPVYSNAKLPDGTPSPLSGPMEGSIAWHSPTTENPALGDTEIWEIWNMTGDAHPIHLHLVHFEVIGRKDIKWDSATEEEERVLDSSGDANGDGTYLLKQPTVQHNSVAGDASTYGSGFKIGNPTIDDGFVGPTYHSESYVENTPKDMVTALPEQVTIIKAKFDKPGRYVWHCHILSHEDHEMMRVLHVGPGAFA